MENPPVNGAGAVDLSALKATAAEREQLAASLLMQAGLLCQCGERIRGEAVVYFALLEGPVPTAQGPQPGIRVEARTLCSRTCVHAPAFEATALARRDGLAGRITWLDERRAARASRNGE
jgi:hypothetical protein